jgi:hypothetical protein
MKGMITLPPPFRQALAPALPRMEELLPRQDRNELNPFPSVQDRGSHAPIQLQREWFRQTRNRPEAASCPMQKMCYGWIIPLNPNRIGERETIHVLED